MMMMMMMMMISQMSRKDKESLHPAMAFVRHQRML